MVEMPILVVERFTTCGINNHLMCYLIEHTYRTFVACVSHLIDPHPLTAHTYIGDKGLYIAMRSYVVRT